jgi:hypothetical protein
LLPPFMPTFRGEDTIFWRTFKVAYPEAQCCHVPLCVRHDSGRPARPLKDFARLRVSTVLDYVLATMRFGARDQARERIIGAGRCLQELAKAPMSLFPTQVFEIVRELCTANILQLTGLLGRRGFTPSYAVAHAQRQVAIYELGRTDIKYALPMEFHGGEAGGWSAFANYLKNFGELLEAWPTISQWFTSRGREHGNAS